jgi:hypothetical protein
MVAGEKKPPHMGSRRITIKEGPLSEEAELRVSISRCSEASKPLSGEIQPSPGFKLVSLTQAMVEYAWTLLQAPYAEDIDEHEDIDVSHHEVWIATAIWNYSSSRRSGREPRRSKTEIINKSRKIMGISEEEAAALFDEMLERKSFLFPEELQPEGLPFKVRRKEIVHLIVPFAQNMTNIEEHP